MPWDRPNKELVDRHPTIETDATHQEGDRWITSGTVTFALAAGPALTFRFADAKSPSEAVSKAALQLRDAAAAFARVANDVLEH